MKSAFEQELESFLSGTLLHFMLTDHDKAIYHVCYLNKNNEYQQEYYQFLGEGNFVLVHDLTKALKVFAQALNNFHDHKVITKTTHESECIGVEMVLYPDRSEVSGTIICQGRQDFLPDDHPVEKLFKNIGMKVVDGTLQANEDCNLELQFNNIAELVEILDPHL